MSAVIKVCLLTRHFNLSGAGIGRVSGEVLRGLKERGHTVLALETQGNSLPSYLKYSLLELKGRISKGYDIYHALTPIESLWIPKDKAVVTFHDLFPIAYPERQGAGIGSSKIKQLIANRYFRFCAQTATRCRFIICHSELIKQDIVKYLKVDPAKIRVLKLGIRDDLEPRPKIDKVIRFGYLGQLDKRKRVDLLVKAFRATKLKAELVIAGTGLEEFRLQVMAMGDSRIKFSGFIPDDKLVDFYNSLDCLVHPTAVEGYSLTPVEAFACKKSVVVLTDAIIPEEVKTRCLQVSTLENFFNHEWTPMPQKLESNYQFARSHSWSSYLEELVKIYEEISKNGN